jgi:uncharacterized protein (DUF1330 family)
LVRAIVWTALLVLGKPAAAQDLVPDGSVLTRLRGEDPEAPVVLVRFLKRGSGGRSAYRRFLEGSRATLEAAGGVRAFGGRIDQLLVGRGPFSFDDVVIDSFPSRRACIEALISEPRNDSVAGVHGVAVRPPGAAEGWLLGTLNRVLAMFNPRLLEDAPPIPVPAITGAVSGVVPGISPDAAQAAVFQEADAARTVVMLNLLRYRAQAVYAPGQDQPERTGEEAYRRYGRSTLPILFRLGGRLLMRGAVEQTLLASAEPLEGPWDQLALVFYPSRLHFRYMVNQPDYQAGLVHRDAGLEATVLLAITPWPEFDPARPEPEG